MAEPKKNEDVVDVQKDLSAEDQDFTIKTVMSDDEPADDPKDLPADDPADAEDPVADTSAADDKAKDGLDEDPDVLGDLGDGKKTVPLATYLEQKRELKEQKRLLQELSGKVTQAINAPASAPDKMLPETIAELVESGVLADDDIVQAKHYAILDRNKRHNDGIRSKVKAAEQNNDVQTQAAVLARAFDSKLPPAFLKVGLDTDTVISQENLDNLTAKDYRDAQSLGPADRVKFFYSRCIERTPELRALYVKVSKQLKNKNKTPKNQQLPKGAGPRNPNGKKDISQMTMTEMSQMSEEELARAAG
jgi:hypothetical protein